MTIPAAPFAFQNRNMEVHDNTFHSNRYLHIFLEVASNYNAADIFVDATAAVSIASASITMSATESGYFPFLNAVLQYRPDNITINALVDFWIEVDIGAGFVQRSAKYPITVDLTHPTKRPFTMPFIPRNAADTAFWVTSRTNIDRYI